MIEIVETLTVPGTIDSLSAIAQYVKQVTTAADLKRQAAYKLRLAVDEIATNIITHGYQKAGLTGEIHLTAIVDNSSLTLSLEDTGINYNPQQKIPLQLEDLTQMLETREIGGLGIHLALNSVDEFRYERIDNRNRNILVVHR
ncbi:ATP-binding protein [Myxosarcina sp. GI1]|uniref:ATP-binding protein n=1 Tax=Myxosarcina sp. GI1 TaxID=1541065 RepID=UPI00209EC939|nr:ATP-binding protein [Myxosarcina sp. GI1]